MKAEGVGLVGSVLIITGIVVTAGVDEICRSELLGWGPCKRAAEEPELTGPDVEADVGAARGDWTGKAAGEEVELATGDGSRGNMANPGVEDPCGVGMADGA